ncbi:MAG: hypothetical protein QOE70_5634 [Chthoniobacter sp.]|jgi:hypothetical protein|nr:hypothetical protein [Chthoniobacter sp.]
MKSFASISALIGHRARSGSTTVVAMVMVSTLATLSATVLLGISARYNSMSNAVAWRQAMNAAESGANVAIQNVHWLNSGASPAFAAAQGWSGPDASGTYTLTNLSVQAGGPGSVRMWSNATVEAPASLIDSRGAQWYRVRATGYAALPGLRRTGDDVTSDSGTRHKNRLRKLDYTSDHFVVTYGEFGVGPSARTVSTPQATRRVEVILQPQGPWNAGVVANSSYDFPYVDSFDSSDPAKSNPDGTYPSSTPSKQQAHGDVIINSNTPPSGTIKGNAGINAGGIATGWGANGDKALASNVSGEVSNNVSVVTPPVFAPAWGATATNAGSSPATITGVGAVSYFRSTRLSNTTVKLPAGRTTAEVNIYVDGDIVSGLTIEPGVTAKIYFTGDFSMKARDMDNQNDRAANLQFYGINPPAGQTQTVTFASGNPGYRYAAWYAPGADFTTNGNPDFVGSFVCKSFTANGNCTLHFDEALGGYGIVSRYSRASWVEDPR